LRTTACAQARTPLFSSAERLTTCNDFLQQRSPSAFRTPGTRYTRPHPLQEKETKLLMLFMNLCRQLGLSKRENSKMFVLLACTVAATLRADQVGPTKEVNLSVI
jgi:hypothetical protein